MNLCFQHRWMFFRSNVVFSLRIQFTQSVATNHNSSSASCPVSHNTSSCHLISFLLTSICIHMCVCMCVKSYSWLITKLLYKGCDSWALTRGLPHHLQLRPVVLFCFLHQMMHFSWWLVLHMIKWWGDFGKLLQLWPAANKPIGCQKAYLLVMTVIGSKSEFVLALI